MLIDKRLINTRRIIICMDQYTFDRIYNWSDIKDWTVKQIQTIHVYDRKMVKQLIYLMNMLNFGFSTEVIIDNIKYIIMSNSLAQVPYVPYFYLDYSYAYYSLICNSFDFLGWWGPQPNNIFIQSVQKYKGMRIYPFLQQHYGIDWSEIAMSIKCNRTPNYRTKPQIK